MPDKLICKHCNSQCPDDTISIGDNVFCCSGCKTVYEILHESNLDGFYDLEQGKGALKPDALDSDDFAFLDNSEIAEKLKKYNINGKSKVVFHLPQIHCSACIWFIIIVLWRINLILSLFTFFKSLINGLNGSHGGSFLSNPKLANEIASNLSVLDF